MHDQCALETIQIDNYIYSRILTIKIFMLYIQNCVAILLVSVFLVAIALFRGINSVWLISYIERVIRCYISSERPYHFYIKQQMCLVAKPNFY